jgi:hypothetical protein
MRLRLSYGRYAVRGCGLGLLAAQWHPVLLVGFAFYLGVRGGFLPRIDVAGRGRSGS